MAGTAVCLLNRFNASPPASAAFLRVPSITRLMVISRPNPKNLATAVMTQPSPKVLMSAMAMGGSSATGSCRKSSRFRPTMVYVMSAKDQLVMGPRTRSRELHPAGPAQQAGKDEGQHDEHH